MDKCPTCGGPMGDGEAETPNTKSAKPEPTYESYMNREADKFRAYTSTLGKHLDKETAAKRMYGPRILSRPQVTGIPPAPTPGIQALQGMARALPIKR